MPSSSKRNSHGLCDIMRDSNSKLQRVTLSFTLYQICHNMSVILITLRPK
jgi:hypothetical protein